MSKIGFQFAEIQGQTRLLKVDLLKALASSSDSKILALKAEAEGVSLFGEAPGETPLVVAVAGQYDAGKSTILRALTGRDDIRTGSDVCTDKVTPYDWNGIKVLDTPGIHSGYRNHDEVTNRAIDQSDLLLFVITNELFDDVTGPHFRELAFSRNKATEMFLAVNKMSQDTGTPEIKRKDIEKVTKPFPIESFRTVFLDALCHIEGLSAEDPEEREELLKIGNMQALFTGLDAFVRERGLLGRLTTPLHSLRSIAVQAADLYSADTPLDRAVLELLHQKRTRILASRARLRSAVDGCISACASEIAVLGDRVAEMIEPDHTGEQVETQHKEAQKKAEASTLQLSANLAQIVEEEVADLRRQFEALEKSALAESITGADLTAGGHFGIQPDAAPGSDWRWSGGDPGQGSTDGLARAKKAAAVAKNIGKMAEGWASGPAAGSARLGSMTAARGSQAHQAVYTVGKFFGANFKPWGAVKIANTIGKVGTVLGAIGGIIGVVTQIYEDHEQEKLRVQLRDARGEVRAAYRESAQEVEKGAWATFDAFDRSFYVPMLQEVDSTSKEMTEKNTRNAAALNVYKRLVGAFDLLVATAVK